MGNDTSHGVTQNSFARSLKSNLSARRINMMYLPVDFYYLARECNIIRDRTLEGDIICQKVDYVPAIRRQRLVTSELPCNGDLTESKASLQILAVNGIVCQYYAYWNTDVIMWNDYRWMRQDECLLMGSGGVTRPMYVHTKLKMKRTWGCSIIIIKL